MKFREQYEKETGKSATCERAIGPYYEYPNKEYTEWLEQLADKIINSLTTNKE